MRLLKRMIIGAAFLIAPIAMSPASAQLGTPPGKPGEIGAPLPKCTKEYKELLKAELAQVLALEKLGADQLRQIRDQVDLAEFGIRSLAKASPELISRAKKVVEGLGGKPEDVDDFIRSYAPFFNQPEEKMVEAMEDNLNETLPSEIRRLLGNQRLTFRLVKQMLSQGEGEIGRHGATERGRINGEIVRCDGQI